MPAAILQASSVPKLASNQPPFRLQVQDVTPVSISLLWSLRPPPISAIHPRSSSSSSIAVRLVKATTSRSLVEPDDWPSDGDGATVVEDDDEDEEESNLLHALTPTTTTAPGAYDSEYEAVAAAGLNERHRPHAVASSSARMARILESGVCVTVNGVPWAHVVMGDRGSDEAIIVVYGLLPGREYSVELSIGGRQEPIGLPANEAHQPETSSLPSLVDSPSVVEAVALLPPAALIATTPPALSGSIPPTDVDPHASHVALAAEVEASQALRASLTSELRKARKDAQRAEGALRAEIEIIKRGLDRMTGTDHRSKQKTLALQESIRQATLQARDLEQEALHVEAQLPDCQAREQSQTQQLEGVRGEVERKAALAEAEIGKDLQALEVREKELTEASRALEQKSAERDRLQKERMAQLEGELTKLHAEIDRTLHAPPPGFGAYGAAHGSPHRIQATAASFVPTQALPRSGRGDGAATATAATLGRGAGPSTRGGSLSRSSSGFNTFHPQRRGGGARVASGSPHQSTTDAFVAYGTSTSSPVPGASPVLAHEAFVPQPSFTGSGTSSALNALGPEFVPASSISINASPVINKARAVPVTSVSSASPSLATTAPVVGQRNSPLLGGGVEYSPTNSARFALPAAALRSHPSQLVHGVSSATTSPSVLTQSTSGTSSPAHHRSPAVKNAMLSGVGGGANASTFDVGSRRGSFAAVAGFESSSSPHLGPASRTWAATRTTTTSATSSPWSHTIALPSDIWSSSSTHSHVAGPLAVTGAGGGGGGMRTRTTLPPHVNVSARHVVGAPRNDVSPGSIGDGLSPASAPVSPTTATAIGSAGIMGSSPRTRPGGSAPSPGLVPSSSAQPLSFANVASVTKDAATTTQRREASA